MTKENREAAYKHFRNLEKEYVAPDHLNNGITSTSWIRAKAKKDADALLKRNPELEIKPEPQKPKSKEKVENGRQ